MQRNSSLQRSDATRIATYILRRPRRIAMVAMLAPALLAAACGGDGSTAPAVTPSTVAGSYAMASARGFTVPHTFIDAAGSRLTIEGGRLVVNGDGTYTLNYKGRLNNLTFDLTDEGTFKLQGSSVLFAPDDDDAYSGRIQGSQIIVDDFRIAGARFDLGFKEN